MTVVPPPASVDDVTVDGLVPHGRRDAWERHLSELVVPMSIRISESDLPQFRGRLRRRWLGDLALVDCRVRAHAGQRRSASREAASDGFVTLVLAVAGCEDVAVGSRRHRIKPGGGVALGEEASFNFQVPGSYRKRILLVPADALREVGEPLTGSGMVLLPPTSATVMLLNRYLESVESMIPALPPGGIEAARNATLDLVAGALQGGGESADLGASRYSPALKIAMDRWIERHLVDPHLSPEALAAAHSVSTRTVHRMFASSGGTFREAVRSRRLAAACEDLTTTDLAVAAIAARWGFADASHFTRTFRSAYGQAPSAYRAERATTGSIRN
ncbi:helix-turn-helix transcriptional regulator [Streptomyces sp. NPDC001156]